ncbi:MAG TPA: hypothetical protein VG537_01745, partial [Candidatus Kapabacteria bacterium]|nr:hypothetical protein [Candidatus Kapabacteria bacterium]
MRTPKEVTPKSFNAARIAKILCITLGCAYIALWIALAYLRLVYPYEVEWMEGAMMDHVMRILDGKPIYTAPTIDFVAWLYPPLYYYAVAAAMKVLGAGWFAARFVSIASTLLTASLLSLITKRITANWLLAFFMFALYIATYHATGFYFDIVRNDAFFVALLVVMAYCALTVRGMAGAVVTALLFILAFFTKQQAVFFLLPFVVWYWLRNRKAAILFTSISVGLIVITLLVLNASTHGWLNYYLFKIPGAKRADFSWFRTLNVFPQYIFAAFTVCSLALVALLAMGKNNWKEFFGSSTGLLAMMTFSSIAAGAMSLGNEGGYENVMMPFAAFVTPLLPIAMYKISEVRPELRRFAFGALLFQFLAFYFNPLSEQMLIASPHQRSGGDQFMRALSGIPGDVFIPYHGYVTRQAGKAPHAHLLAMMDVFRMHDTTAARLQRDMDSAYARHQFAGIILEE